MPKLEGEAKKELNERIHRNIDFLIAKDENYNQADFLRFCEKTYGVELRQGNLSNLLNNKKDGNIHVLVLYLISQYFGIDMIRLIEEDLTACEQNVNLMSKKNSLPQKNIRFNITDDIRNFYCGDYHCYFYPTKSDEDKIICGKVKIKEDTKEQSCCVSIEIDTNQMIAGTNEPYIKVYDGILFYSKKLKICYCIVQNEELGECNFIAFRYHKLNNTRYRGGMAAVLTTSAGSDNVPTMHRMVISRDELDDNKLNYIKGNLLLNYSDIIVEERAFEEIIQTLDIDEDVKERLRQNSEKKTYYEISERFLRSIKRESLKDLEPVELVAQLRAVSTALRYNKVSKKLDENIMNLLKKKI